MATIDVKTLAGEIQTLGEDVLNDFLGDGATAHEREGVAKERSLLGLKEGHEGGLLRRLGLRLAGGGHWQRFQREGLSG